MILAASASRLPDTSERKSWMPFPRRGLIFFMLKPNAGHLQDERHAI
jgi:hypothetical protein